MLDEMTGSYLARRGKHVFCDKSLGSARHADLLLQIYPQARFICLYRHPMDTIRSGLDACPLGLNGYGFDPYIAGSPGNAVLALARYWLDHATAIARGGGASTPTAATGSAMKTWSRIPRRSCGGCTRSSASSRLRG